jgi:HPt (histidine-containing phosphotransfer) domain-containing protein
MTPTFNEAEALARLGDNKDLLLKISAYFVAYAQGQISELRDAYIGDDTERLRFLTHRMLGSLANFGTSRAYQAAHSLQSLLDENTGDGKDGVTATYQEMMRELETFRKELAVYSDGVTPPDINS